MSEAAIQMWICAWAATFTRRLKRRGRNVFVPGLVLAWTLLAPLLPGAAPVYALDPNKRVTQYIHTSWRIQDGSAPDGMFSIAQTSDGFLWFTSASQGMYRFDGVRLLPWTLAVEGKTIDHALSFHGDHAGGLWAVGEHEIFHLKGGVVISHFALEAQYRTENISVDPDGSLWALDAGYEIREPLCHVTDHGVKCFGESDGLLIPNGGEALLADGKGGFWLGGQRAVVRWHEGASEVYPIEALKSNSSDGVAALALDSNGSLWVGLLQQGPGKGLGRLESGVFKSFVTPGFDGSKLSVFAMTVDRQGSLWVGTTGDGLFRIRGTSVEHYGQAEGLSGDSVQAIYEDREGNLWVATTNGIDRFRDAAVATFSKLEGLGNDLAVGVLASRDGTIWVANKGSLDRIAKNGAVSSIRWGKGLPGNQVTAMLEDRAGNLWMGVHDGLYLLKNGRFRRIPEPDHQPLGLVLAMTEDSDGNIWAVCSGKSRKLIRLRDFQVREEFPTSQIPRGRIAPDPHGGIWIGPRSGGSLVLFRDGVQKSFATGSPANLGTNHLFVQADGSVLAAFDDGLVGLRQGQVQRMTTKNGLPCNAVYSFIEDKEKRWWLLTECGVVEIPDSELQRWWANPEAVVRTRLYDALDGARPGRYGINSAALSPDGRVWFATGFLVQMVDPSRLSQKALPPVTYVESVTADRNVFAASDDLKLPAHLHDLQIDYTSPTFSTPQKVRFRYRLDPYDHDWHDAGTRRQAFYTDLPPGRYTFRVMACNNDGAWNESAAKLDFSVDPAYYQTTWFLLSCGAAFLALLWAGYQLRVRQLARQFNLAFEARVSERTRIARELHDTLLQSFQGLLLRFQSASRILPERPVEAKQRLDSALDQSAAAIAEGRDAVQGLRSSAFETNDLANGIIAIGADLTSDASALDSPAIDVEVEGAPRNLNAIVRDEAYRIAGEALRNAFRHARARRITVELQYDKRQFRLRVRDDGKGFDEEAIQLQPTGHFGLPGMRERAEDVGGRLEVRSRVDSGTEVELSIPGNIAYGGSARRSWFSKVLSGNSRGHGSTEP